MKIGKGGQLARSAGTYVQLVGRDAGLTRCCACVGRDAQGLTECMATVGAVSNPTA
jgi:large subunit ribosomal protein L2